MNDVITFGDTVKSLGDGRVGGYLVRFTDAEAKDLSGEYFTAKTYYGAKDGDGIDCLFHHSQPIEGIDEALTDHLFAPIKTRKDSIGIFAETVLDMADAYERKVAELVDAGKLGWSSGAAGHTCRKSADGEILRWILAEGSLTPSPCDAGNRGGIRPLKSLELTEEEGQEIKDVMATGSKAVMTTGSGYAPANNRNAGMPAAPPAPPVISREHDLTPNAHQGDSVRCPSCHLWAHMDAEHTTCPYCGVSLSAADTPAHAPAAKASGLPFGEELDMALAAVESCTARAEALRDIRVKDARTLSSSTQGKIQDLSERLVKLLASIKPEDLDALQAQQTVVGLACMEAQMAVYEAQRAAENAVLMELLDSD